MTLLHAAQDTPDKGTLQVNVISSENNFPVENATVSIANTDTPDQVIEELTTNSWGRRSRWNFPLHRWNTASRRMNPGPIRNIPSASQRPALSP